MADGSTRAIKDIAVGDKVTATDPATGKTTAQPVTALHRNHDTDLTDVTIAIPAPPASSKPAVGPPAKTAGASLSTLHTTAHHPFWDQTAHAWVAAAALAVGHQLRTIDGRVVTVVGVYSHTASKDMRDLTVAHIHTYYVIAGNTPVLVHNCGDLVGDAGRFPNAHVLTEHVNVSQQEAIALAASKGGPNGVFTDSQMAQVVVDYTQAFHSRQIANWLRGSEQQLAIQGNYGVGGGSLGWIAMPDGTVRTAGNAFTVVLQRQPGHAAGYYVYSAYPR
jgi:hypothetical protein